jgi:hypothetical protein
MAKFADDNHSEAKLEFQLHAFNRQLAGAAYCVSGDHLQVRSITTSDRPDCLVNHCIPAQGTGSD